MRLRKVQSDNWQKCCRWCHYFQDGVCCNNELLDNESSLFLVAETGVLDEVIRETLEESDLKPFKELEYKLREWNISEKRIKSFDQLFKDCYEKWCSEIRPKLDENIDFSYQNYFDTCEDGVHIKDPSKFCCDRWC